MERYVERGALEEEQAGDRFLVQLPATTFTALEVTQDEPDRVMGALAESIRFYLGPDRGEPGWAYPKFLAGGESGELIEVPIDRDSWAEVRAESERQAVSPEALLQHCVLYFVAARDAGRLVSSPLGATDEGTRSLRGNHRRSA